MAEEGQDPFLASLSDDGRYRLLVEAVTDYAIYMLDRNGIVGKLECRCRSLQGIRADRNHWAALLPVLYAGGSSIGLPARALEDCGARRQVRE